MAPLPTAQYTLLKTTTLKNEGNKALANHDFSLVTSTYRNALKELMPVFIREKDDNIIHEREFAKTTDRQTAMVLGLQLPSALAATHLKRSEWATAYHWGSQALY